jgi:hypothetical protein
MIPNQVTHRMVQMGVRAFMGMTSEHVKGGGVGGWGSYLRSQHGVTTPVAAPGRGLEVGDAPERAL